MVEYKNKGKLCSLEGCARTAHLKGYCRTHYDRLRRHGDPNICLTTEKFAALNLANEASLSRKEECVLWPYRRDKYGYAVLRVGDKKTLAQIYICEKAHGPKPSQLHEAAHSCGNGHQGCVNGNHLRWATRSQNQMDRVNHGTSNRGEKNHLAKLTKADALFIKENYLKIPTPDLASMFGVSLSTPHAIATGKTWAWLESEVISK